MNKELEHLLELSEQETTDRLNFHKFTKLMEQDYYACAIEVFWTIMHTEAEGADLEWREHSLRKQLGEMDEEEAPYIMKAYDIATKTVND